MMNSHSYLIKTDAAVFIDRDGVINALRVQDYVKSKDEFILLPEVIPAFTIFRKLFSRVFVITNQQGIAKGLMKESIDDIHAYFISLLPEGIRPDQIYHCPHLATDHCVCRKPKPGMAFMAKNDYPEINLSSSFMIGDSQSDLQFGEAAGMTSLFISKEKVDVNGEQFVFSNLMAAADYLDNLKHPFVK